jgi:hypothetical protein
MSAQGPNKSCTSGLGVLHGPLTGEGREASSPHLFWRQRGIKLDKRHGTELEQLGQEIEARCANHMFP